MATRNTNITVPKLVKPTVGKHVDTWGYILNENFDKLSEFHTKIVSDSEMQNQELARLENEKLNIEDIPSKVEPVVQEFLETTIKPEIDDYIDTVSKPDITKHVETKKQEINTYVNTTSKPALDSYEKEKEKELNTYTTTKKGELDSHTIAKKGELDAYEKTKETQLNNYTGTKQTQLDSYTNTKKGELDTHTTAKEGQLDTHTAEKKSELDAYEETKEGELNTFTSAKKTEITNHTNTKKRELDTYTTQKKGEITTHTDSEIERINADSELANKANKTIQVIAGNGLVGGGDLSTNRTFNIASADDGITVNADNIKLNIVDNATTDSATRAGSARQVKLLSENKQNKTDSGLKTNKKNVIDAINSSLNMKERPASFDGTFIDFYNKFKIGSYAIPREVEYFDKFGFPDGTYNYGVLTVYETVEGALRIDFYTDGHREKLTTTIYQFGFVQTRPEWQSKTFKDNIKWNLQLTDKSKLFLGTSGISSVTYIQDSGTKTQGQGYIDKSTGQVYLCLETNTDTTITNKFMSITNVELGKKVESGFWKLNSKIISDGNFDILGIYEPGFYMADSDGKQANWLNKPYVNAICYGLLYQKQNGNRRSVIYIGSNGGIYTNVQLDNGSSKTWIGWKKAITDADIIDNLTTSDKSKVLSANMGKYLDADKPSKNKVETITNYWTFEGKTPFIKFKKTGEQSLPSEGYSAFVGFGSSVRPHELQIRNLYDDGTVNIVSTNLKTGNKDIPKAINEVYDSQLGTQGISSIIYIQDAGQKTAGNGYVDKTTGQLYLCKTTNSDTSVTSNFTLATNIENSNKIKMISKIRIRNGYTIWAQHYFNGMYLQVFSSTVSSVTENVILSLDELGVSDNNYKLQAVSFNIGVAVKNDNVSIPLGIKSEENARTITLSLTDYSNLKFVHGMCFIPSNKIQKLSQVD